MSGFVQALERTLRHEGGYADHPDDPGGATMKGVTQAVYDEWRAQSRKAPLPVRDITEDELTAIYHTRYWMEAKCESLPWPLSALHFDAAVNHGPTQATKILQRAVGTDPDGIHGPATERAVRATSLGQACREQIRHRLDFYVLLWMRREPLRVFMGGWCSRALDMWQYAIRQTPEVR